MATTKRADQLGSISEASKNDYILCVAGGAVKQLQIGTIMKKAKTVTPEANFIGNNDKTRVWMRVARIVTNESASWSSNALVGIATTYWAWADRSALLSISVAYGSQAHPRAGVTKLSACNMEEGDNWRLVKVEGAIYLDVCLWRSNGLYNCWAVGNAEILAEPMLIESVSGVVFSNGSLV